MRNNWFYVPSIFLGIGAFILFVLSLAVYLGWLSTGSLLNVQQAALAVYGVIVSGAAIGLYILSRNGE